MRKPVRGFEGLYEVDENGNVYSVRRGKILKPVMVESGYMHVHLCNKKSSVSRRLHRVVAEAFIDNPNGYEQVNHINGDKCDNRAVNLEWCDGPYNMRHAIEQGLFNPAGERNPSSKLDSKIVDAIRIEYRRGCHEHGTVALGKKYGVSDVMISKIVRGKCWKSGFDTERSLHREE